MPNTQFRGVTEIGESLLSDQLENSLINYFQWSLLCVGGFFNVRKGQSGVPQGDMSRLRLSEDRNYTKGRVWESARQDWVWETGVPYRVPPINISGVYIGGTFYGTGTNVPTGSGFHINYPLGRIVFDNPISTTANVQCEYSYRFYNFTSSNVPWWRQLQVNSFRVDDPTFMQYGSGHWTILGQNRVQMPAVVVEATTNTSRKPFEIGDLNAIVRQDVHFHILSETPWDRKTIHDIITYQWQMRVGSVDKNLLMSNNAFPLDERGMRKSNARMWPQLVAATGDGGYGWRQIRFHNVRSVSSDAPPLYYTMVVATCEVDLP